MMTSKERQLTYTVTICHYFILSLLNYLCYAHWGEDGIVEAPGAFLLSIGYWIFLIVYTCKGKKSAIAENLGLDLVLWLLQWFLMLAGIYDPKIQTHRWFYGIGFFITPMIYVVVEGIMLTVTLITFLALYLAHKSATKKGN